MEQMQQQNMSWIEVQFLNKAIDILCQCRRTLMYTYVFAFYLNKNNQSIIFEDNQQDLEIATEQLSEFLERDLDQEHVETLKQKVQDKYRIVEIIVDVLYRTMTDVIKKRAFSSMDWSIPNMHTFKKIKVWTFWSCIDRFY
uniref:Ariadne domain-containing protein n=1 Tax=Romanomermis culicivorax TaxID=13658 RepID=A0A915HUR5_ROMCU